MRNVIKKNAPHSGNTPKRMAAERKIGMLFTVAINEIKPNEMEIMERNITQIINENNNYTLDTAVILYCIISSTPLRRIIQTSTRFYFDWNDGTLRLYVEFVCYSCLVFFTLVECTFFFLFWFFFYVSWMQCCLYTTPAIEKLKKQLLQHIFLNLVPATA